MTGLDYAVNRTYDSKIGRFAQIDPMGMKATERMAPQTLNLYNYCGNDPINFVDSDGLSWIGNFFKKLFKVIKTIRNVIRKIIRFAQTIAAIVMLFVAPYAALMLFAISVVQQLVGIVAETIWRNIKESVRENGFSLGSIFKGLWRGIKQSFDFLKAIVTRGLKDWFVPVYGYWCAPGWGIDGPSNGEEPIDEFDAACKKHDEDMKRVDDMLARGEITKKEAKRLKVKYDLQFMRKILSANARHGNPMFAAVTFLSFLFGRVIPAAVSG